ncbi:MULTISPECIES: protein kinase domain-containing protein [unclassified Streptomyces]|uniref:serine/threonine-protein kinase n=1 Tax=unclassified Streptomyces TaxID=2593676 RepID=UPI00379497A0
MPLSDADSAMVGGYELMDRLGSGGMGMVYLARSASGRRVAVKVVHEQYAENEEFRMRFRQEIAAARRVSGAFTAPVVDADPEAVRPWMATLYVPGRTLAQRVREDGPLAGAELRVLALGLSEALQDIHRAGVVHRDLKPANVLMAEDGPRVIDFGISRVADHQMLTATGRALGTPPYMSPEQLASTRDVGPASDVFSLAAVLTFAACGYGPFDAESSYTTAYNVVHTAPVLDDVPEALRSILARCLEKDPAVRPGLAELLALFQTLPPLQASPPRRTSPSPGAAGQPHTPATGVLPPTGVLPRDPSPPPARPARLRGRRVLPAALAVAVAAAGLTAAVILRPGGGGGEDGAGAKPSTSRAPAPVLPEGWRPWLNTMRTQTPMDGGGDGDSGCLAPRDALYCGGRGYTAARLDAATGKTEWRFSAGIESSVPVMVRDGVVVVNDMKGPSWSTEVRQWVTGLSADSAEVEWTHSIADGSRPVPFGKWVVALSVNSRHFVAMNADDGVEAWRFTIPEGDHCLPWSGGGALYARCFPVDDPTVEGELWQIGPAGEGRAVAAVPSHANPVGVDGDELVLLEHSVDAQDEPGDYTSALRIHTTTGKSRRVPLPEQGRVTPDGRAPLIGQTLYLVRDDGTVTAVSARTGKVRWRRDTEVEGLSAPVLSEKYGALYLVNGHGRLLALGKADGRILWKTPSREGASLQQDAGPPTVRLKGDAIVAHAGGLTFSVSPLEPNAPVER